MVNLLLKIVKLIPSPINPVCLAGRKLRRACGSVAAQSKKYFLATLGAGHTIEKRPLSEILISGIYRICELIKTAARWCIMAKI